MIDIFAEDQYQIEYSLVYTEVFPAMIHPYLENKTRQRKLSFIPVIANYQVLLISCCH